MFFDSTLQRPQLRNKVLRGLKPVKNDLKAHSLKIRYSNYIARLSNDFSL